MTSSSNNPPCITQLHLPLMLHQHQPMLRPSRNARRRPPPPLPLPSLPATMHGVVSPSRWSRRSGWSIRYLHRRQTTEPILIAINLKASQHQPRPWWPHPTRQQRFHLRWATSPDQLVAAAVTPPRSQSTAYPQNSTTTTSLLKFPHSTPRWTRTTTPSGICLKCKCQTDMNRVRVSSLIQTTDNRFHFYFQSLPLSCFSSLPPNMIFFFAWGVSLRHITSANLISTYSALFSLFLYST